MSSVFHEIVSYGDFDKGIFEQELNKIKPDYIFFRDMMTNESINRNINLQDLEKIKKCPLFEDYENTNKFNTQFDILDFLFKYRYIKNWKREKDEIYFPIDIEEFEKKLYLIIPNYSIIYKKHYILPYLKNKIKEDFDIDLVDNTHINFIFKRDK